LAEANLSDDERRVLDRFLERAREDRDIEAVWLYGSRARGEGSLTESDVDLLVITRGDPRTDSERVSQLIWRAAEEVKGNPIPFLAHVRDRPWLANRRAIRSFFIQDVDREKIVLLGEP
jgi:predicted nucleotidyltransferase